MAEPAERLATVAEFLDWHGDPDTRYELVRGRIVAMAPVAAARSVITANLGAALSALSKPGYVGMRAGVTRPDRVDTFYQADLVVSCSPVQKGLPTIPDPVVIIEILSRSAIEHDRGRKLYDYRRIPSVQEIALVSSENRHVELWRRNGAKWTVEDLIGDAALRFASIGAAVPFAEIYADSGVP